MGLGLVIAGIAASTLGNAISGLMGSKAQKDAAKVLAGANAEQQQMFKNYYERSFGEGSYNKAMQNIGIDAAQKYVDLLNDEDSWDRYLTGEKAYQAPEEFDFTAEDLYSDPSYDFRLQEGLNEVEQSAIANGLSRSGAAAKALNDYAQNVASKEYQTVYQRAFNEYEDQRDFDYGLWKDEMTQYYNNLSNKLSGQNNLMEKGNSAARTQAQALSNLGSNNSFLMRDTSQAESIADNADLMAGSGIVKDVMGGIGGTLQHYGTQSDPDVLKKELEGMGYTVTRPQATTGTAIG